MASKALFRATAITFLCQATLPMAFAQPTAAVPAPTPSFPSSDGSTTGAIASPAAPAFLPKGTLIEVSVDETVSSEINKTDDWFGITLTRPIVLNGVELIPAGTRGRGQVVHAAKMKHPDKAGELFLAARYLEMGGRQIPLRGMTLGVSGISETKDFYYFTQIRKSDVVVPPGYRATAKLNIDLYPQTNEPQVTAPTEAQ